MSGEAKENSPHKNRSADRRIENTTCVRVPHCVLYLNIQKKAVSSPVSHVWREEEEKTIQK